MLFDFPYSASVYWGHLEICSLDFPDNLRFEPDICLEILHMIFSQRLSNNIVLQLGMKFFEVLV